MSQLLRHTTIHRAPRPSRPDKPTLIAMLHKKDKKPLRRNAAKTAFVAGDMKNLRNNAKGIPKSHYGMIHAYRKKEQHICFLTGNSQKLP